jgi:hypothetical protein
MRTQGPISHGLICARRAGSTTRSGPSRTSTQRLQKPSRSSANAPFSARRCMTSRRFGSRTSTRSSPRHACASSRRPRSASSHAAASACPTSGRASSAREGIDEYAGTRRRAVPRRKGYRPPRCVEGGFLSSSSTACATGRLVRRDSTSCSLATGVSKSLRETASTHSGAYAIVCPSPCESLSFAQLEPWSHGRPTLANAVSPVLVGQSLRAGGGLWYESAAKYATMLDLLAEVRPLAAR